MAELCRAGTLWLRVEMIFLLKGGVAEVRQNLAEPARNQEQLNLAFCLASLALGISVK